MPRNMHQLYPSVLYVQEQEQWQREVRMHCMSWRQPPPRTGKAPKFFWSDGKNGTNIISVTGHDVLRDSACVWKSPPAKLTKSPDTHSLFTVTTRKVLQYVLSLEDAFKTKMVWPILTISFDPLFYLTNRYSSLLSDRKHWLHVIRLQCSSVINLVIGVIYAFFPYLASTVSIKETCRVLCREPECLVLWHDSWWSCWVLNHIQTFNPSMWRAF